MTLLETFSGFSEFSYFWEVLALVAFGLLYLAYYLRYR